MIPILYDSSETAFTSNGLGRLTECTSCRVTEVRNGEYECEFKYPVTGRLYDQITEGTIISCTHDDQGDRQPFVIYRKSNPDLKGVVTFNAHHLTYLLNNIIMVPFTAQSAGAAFALFETQTVNTNPFTFWTDNTTAGTAKSDVPIAVRAALGGTDGSVLDAFHGEYEWDVMQVKLHAQRGTDSGITIRYGKNLTDLKQTRDGLGTYNAAVGYWFGEVNGVDVLVQTGIIRGQDTNNPIPVVLDMSSEFESQPSVSQVEAKVREYLNSNTPWVLKENYKINFVQLWQTEEFKDVAALQRLSLCDRVSVYYPQLGVEVDNVEIIKVVYNVLLDRYDEMELGQPTSTLAQTLIKPYQDEIKKVMQNAVTNSAMQAAIEHATQLITGGAGGVFKWKYNADGEPIELLILDTGDEATAVNVWRWNAGGLGHSSNGVNGPFADVAITMDGQINANAITTGLLSASMIKGGTFKAGGGGNGNGTIQIYDANNNLIGTLDNTGADLTGRLTLKMDPTMAHIGKVPFYSFNTFEGMIKRKTENGFMVRYIDRTLNGKNSVALHPDIYQQTKVTSITGTGYSDYDFDYERLTQQGNNYNFIKEWDTIKGRKISIWSLALPSSFTDSDEDQSIRWNSSRTRHLYFGLDGICYAPRMVTGNSQSSDYAIDEYIINQYSQTLYTYPRLGNNGANDSWGFIFNKTNLMVCIGTNSYMIFNSSGLSVLGNMVAYQSSSSRRYKHDIKTIEDKKLDPHRLYDLPVRQFKYNDDATLQYADMEGQTLPGFIAEEVAAVYPSAVIRGEDGKIESWDERRILPGMLALIQEQKQTIESLQARVEKLESLINTLL